MEKNLEEVRIEGRYLALILRAEYSGEGVNFLTPNDFSQQLAYMRHPAGKEITPHVHNEVERNIRSTKEVLVIRSGRLRVDFYRDDHTYLESRVLGAGDIILLSEGGHGFKCLEETEMIEIKQGPYAGANDKVRFEPAVEDAIRIKDEGNGNS
jgi:mannose-6-phosphate isomerase-like protein (cupin superfamily)